jgi:hypothetical protein
MDGLARRSPGEDADVRAFVSEELRRGWGLLAGCLASKGKAELEQKSRAWFDTYLEEAVRAAERRANARLSALASEVEAPRPEPLTVWQLVSLSQREEVKVSTPESNGAAAVGSWAGLAAGAAIGSFVPVIGTALGAMIGIFSGGLLGGWLGDDLTKKEPDYAGDYTMAARTDWDKVAPAFERLTGVQFKARLDALFGGLGQRVHDLERTLPVSKELDLRRRLRAILMCDGRGRVSWRFDRQARSVAFGKVLRLETRAPAVIRWSSDGWKTYHDTETCDIGLGLHVAELPTEDLPTGGRIQFTFRWPEVGRWEGRDFAVEIGEPGGPANGRGEGNGRSDRGPRTR